MLSMFYDMFGLFRTWLLVILILLVAAGVGFMWWLSAQFGTDEANAEYKQATKSTTVLVNVGDRVKFGNGKLQIDLICNDVLENDKEDDEQYGEFLVKRAGIACLNIKNVYTGQSQKIVVKARP